MQGGAIIEQTKETATGWISDLKKQYPGVVPLTVQEGQRLHDSRTNKRGRHSQSRGNHRALPAQAPTGGVQTTNDTPAAAPTTVPTVTPSAPPSAPPMVAGVPANGQDSSGQTRRDGEVLCSFSCPKTGGVITKWIRA